MNNQVTDKAVSGKSDSIKKSSDNTSGIGGLTTFAILLVIGGIATTGFLYKKAGGDFNEMVKLSRTFYYDTSNLLTEKYISFINNAVDAPSNVEQDVNASPVSADTDTVITQNTQHTAPQKAESGDVDKALAIVSNVEPEADKNIPETTTAVTIKEDVLAVTETPETKLTEITAVNSGNIISNDASSETVPSDTELAETARHDTAPEVELITQAQIIVAKPVKESLASSVTTNPPKTAYAAYRFNPERYSPQPVNSFYLQQQRIFEQNRRYQQQMMNQAFMLQTALLKDAEMRHQQMLRRAADWKLQVQQRRQETQNRFYQPAYMN